MNCEFSKRAMPEYWAGSLSESDRVNFEVHISECAECRSEAEDLSKLWRGIGLIPAAETAEPSREMRARFYQSLSAYQAGLEESKKPAGPSLIEVLKSLWPKQPMMQFGAAMAMLVVGIGAGWYARTPAVQKDDTELARLRGEVGSMKQLVTLSLLQQQSASDRLRGVSWAYRVEQSDTEVLAALLTTVNQDQSVNVRLAAVDALRPFAASPVARKGIVKALLRQESPLVQAALIDLVVAIKEAPAKSSLETLSEGESYNPAIRERAKKALSELQ
ncbi:MAG: zf-HC2 domain-containing protein [Bryobacteraceae bacterium]